jgi:2-polyprenyl-3-methyl-5-hydroxy-6-metoxy-1,4-benzoquinol methylase
MTAEKPKAWFTVPGVQDGKHRVGRQLRGLGRVRRACHGAAVLDLGCAEGAISLEMAKAGARLVHGVEVMGSRVSAAEALFQERCPDVEHLFFEWDLNRFEDLFLNASFDSAPDGRYLLTRYDIVLCLAIAQKLSNPGRFLRLASTLCSRLMAVRLPAPVLDDKRSMHIPVDVARMLGSEFDLIQETEGYPRDLARPYQAGDRAWLGIFRRKRPPAKTARLRREID